jgi:hypothetical protein
MPGIMIIKSLSELQEADERTMRFHPLGLGGHMRPEDSAEFQQQVIARYQLVSLDDAKIFFGGPESDTHELSVQQLLNNWQPDQRAGHVAQH